MIMSYSVSKILNYTLMIVIANSYDQTPLPTLVRAKSNANVKASEYEILRVNVELLFFKLSSMSIVL